MSTQPAGSDGAPSAAAPEPGEVTRLLLEWQGEGATSRGTVDRLTALLYDDLRRRAASYLRLEPVRALEATDLVHEAYLSLVDQSRVTWRNRSHFLGVAASQMRRILIDQARARGADKRGGGAVHLTLGAADEVAGAGRKVTDLLALDDALRKLAVQDERKARLVELRFFGGLGLEEAADILGISPATAKRDWSFARAWLRRELGAGAPS